SARSARTVSSNSRAKREAPAGWSPARTSPARWTSMFPGEEAPERVAHRLLDRRRDLVSRLAAERERRPEGVAPGAAAVAAEEVRLEGRAHAPADLALEVSREELDDVGAVLFPQGLGRLGDPEERREPLADADARPVEAALHRLDREVRDLGDLRRGEALD